MEEGVGTAEEAGDVEGRTKGRTLAASDSNDVKAL